MLVPVSTLRLRLNSELDVPGRGLRVSSILVGLVSEQLTDDAAAQIRTALRAVRSVPPGAIDDFEMSLPTEALGVLRGINGAITGFVALVAGISLLVGGIGIMNIMLVAVTERTREIGVRKALGATDRDILGQFVLEATAVSLIGGAIGVSGAIGLVLLVGTLSGIAAPIAWGAVIIALVFAAFVGIGFGSYPARRAALLLPVEALRYE
jgi:putative ABC transport system permease protein